MQNVEFSFEAKSKAFSGLNALVSGLVEDYGTRYAIVDQEASEPEPYQVILMDSDFQPVDHANLDTFWDVEKWLRQRGVSVVRNDDVEVFINRGAPLSLL
jgi:hypothetical protein